MSHYGEVEDSKTRKIKEPDKDSTDCIVAGVAAPPEAASPTLAGPARKGFQSR